MLLREMKVILGSVESDGVDCKSKMLRLMRRESHKEYPNKDNQIIDQNDKQLSNIYIYFVIKDSYEINSHLFIYHTNKKGLS